MPARAKKPRVTRDPDRTREALITAARLEFEEPGYEQTNTNKIAQRAGYAPQTFYRHFADKLEIFLAVYEDWSRTEQAALDHVRDAGAVAQILIRHHKQTRVMRRTLRYLSVTEPRVRAARAQTRLEQIERIRGRLKRLANVPHAELAARLLLVERLSDACAEGELSDLGLSATEAASELTKVLRFAFAARA
jgi:AcrR family transcriptional regulator